MSEPIEKNSRSNKVTLEEYIKFVGFSAAAHLFDSKPTTTKSWAYGLRQPSIRQAKIIIQRAGRKLDFESIYGSFDVLDEDYLEN